MGPGRTALRCFAAAALVFACGGTQAPPHGDGTAGVKEQGPADSGPAAVSAPICFTDPKPVFPGLPDMIQADADCPPGTLLFGVGASACAANSACPFPCRVDSVAGALPPDQWQERFTYTYDDRRRPLQMKTERRYSAGEVVQFRDVRWRWGARGRVVSQISEYARGVQGESGLTVTETSASASERVLQYGSIELRQTYDERGRLASESSPGLVHDFVIENGRVVAVRRQGDDGEELQTSYEYDDRGRLAAINSEVGALREAYIYDSRGRIARQTIALESGGWEQQYSYGPDDRIVEAVVRSGTNVVRYHYEYECTID